MLEVIAPIAVIVMCLTTYLTRIGGFVIMSWFTITPRVARILEALTGSTLVALVVPAAMHGDNAAKFAVIAAATVMAVSRNALAAMISGVAAAAVGRIVL